MPLYDRVKTEIFFAGIGFLAVLVGWLNYGAFREALYIAIFKFALLLLAFLFFKYVLKDEAVEKQSLFWNIRITVETHASMASYLRCNLSKMMRLLDYRRRDKRWL